MIYSNHYINLSKIVQKMLSFLKEFSISGLNPEESTKKSEKRGDKNMGLKLGDIQKGGLAEVEVVDTTVSESEGTTVVVINVRDMQGNDIDKIGFYGQDILQCALDKGWKDDDGRVFVQVPAKNVTKGEKRVNWVNNKF